MGKRPSWLERRWLGPAQVSSFRNYGYDRAIALFNRKDDWAAVMRNAMTADFSWDKSASAYLRLYQRLVRHQT